MDKSNGKKLTTDRARTGKESPLTVTIDGGARLAEEVVISSTGVAREGREATASIATATLDWLDASQRAGLRVARTAVERLDRLAEETITWIERLALSGVQLARDTTKDVAEVAGRASLTLVRPSDEPATRAA